VLVAALTSAVGYVVLAGSSLSMIRQFGVALAGSVALSYLAAVLVLRLLPDRGEPEPAGATSPACPSPSGVMT
jgi:hypothetical protein